MKKLLSVLLVFCMIFSVSVMPATAVDTAESTAETTVDYYKWDFSADKLWTDYESERTYGENGYTYNPVSTQAKKEISYGTIDGLDALRVKIGGASNGNFIVPLKNDGTPFVMETGKTYYVKLTGRFRTKGSTASRFGIAPYTRLDGKINSSTSNSLLKFTDESGLNSNIATWGSLYKYNNIFYGNSAAIGGVSQGVVYNNKLVAQSNEFYINETGFEVSYDNRIIMASSGDETAAGVTKNTDGSYTDTVNSIDYNSFFAIAFPATQDQYYIANDGASQDEESFATKTGDDSTVYSQIYMDFYLTELEIIKTGCCVTELYANGEIYDVLTGETGATVALPTPEAPEGYSFEGWYYDEEFTTPCEDFTFADGITQLYAYFKELEKTTVTFIGADGTNTIDTKSGIPGEPLELPDTGIIDTNWYTDYEKNEVYSSAVFPEEDIILYAAPLNNGITEKYYSGLYYSAGTTTDENGEAVPTLYYDGSKGILTGGPTVHYRLGTVEDQVSYKVSFSYKADEITNGTNISFATADPKNASNLVMMVEGAKGEDALYVINAENTKVGEWNTVDIFFTANLNGYIAPTGIYGDYEFTSHSANNSNNGLFLMLSEVTNGTDKIHFKDFTVTSLGYALEATGASLLTGKAETISDGQAIRYFFDYKTSDGFHINLGGTDYKIVERGVIFRDGAEPKYYDNDGAKNVKIKDRKPNTTLSFSDNAELKVVASDSAKLNNCWEYNDAGKMMTYSYYVHGFETDDSKKLMARGYVTFDDGKGNQFTVYSAETTRSVELMKNANNITY